MTQDIVKDNLSIYVEDGSRIHVLSANGTDVFRKVRIVQDQITGDKFLEVFFDSIPVKPLRVLSLGELESLFDTQVLNTEAASVVEEQTISESPQLLDMVTELSYVKDVTSNVQAQLDSKADKTELSTHTTDGTIHITSTDRMAWDYANKRASEAYDLASEVKTEASKKADAAHTHNYAASSSAGGSATSAVKLDTATAGSATQPVYFTEGKPTACTYTLGKSVPSDAKFTDTTYSVATTSATGLMSATDKSKLNCTNIAYATCSTAAATAEKVIMISTNGSWSLNAGSRITIKFSHTNTASNPKFKVGNYAAYPVWYNTSVITTSNLSYAGYANRPMDFVYDGTQFVFIGWSTDSNTSNTAGTTDKTATKLFLAGATSQGSNPVTYSNNKVYIGTDNCLYSNGVKVATTTDIGDISTALTSIITQTNSIIGGS